ncbi:hypothetical protein OUZ56_006375 [Daphnia magna]|nr:hypothetical protein OUZ56_006375 [Daphnia magna]
MGTEYLPYPVSSLAASAFGSKLSHMFAVDFSLELQFTLLAFGRKCRPQSWVYKQRLQFYIFISHSTIQRKQQTTMASIKMIVLWAFLVVLVAAVNAAPRYFIIDDGEVDVAAPSPLVRVRRQDKYVASASGGNYGKGAVGPVYTFVKTDPKANFKWGVRHRAGVQYGR